jgi:diketogulonate reductase-like aldo/keto reductase
MFEEIKIDTTVKLNNGVEMPIFGLGTYRARAGEAREAVLQALKVGYRLIDTASMYGNEEDIGKALKQSGLSREEVFITTKLWNSDNGYDKALAAFEESRKKLGLDYVDLYLIHWPVEGLRSETWRAMEKLLEQGKCRSIGVSNYMTWHLKELLSHCSIIPAVNQVEFHPYLYLKDLLDFCQSHNIQLESYSPLTKGVKLNDPKLADLALKYSKAPAQILIRWVLQHGVVVIPKSTKKERIEENVHVFDFTISPEDMNALDSFHRNLRTSWDPSRIP